MDKTRQNLAGLSHLTRHSFFLGRGVDFHPDLRSVLTTFEAYRVIPSHYLIRPSFGKVFGSAIEMHAYLTRMVYASIR